MIRNNWYRSFLAFGAVVGSTLGASAEETVGTLTLDALSYVSFQNQEIVTFPTGSTIRFHFGEPAEDGTLGFTLGPADVSIDPIPLGGGATLRYGLAAPTHGTLARTLTGRRLTFNATVTATYDSPEGGGTYIYTMPFTTESASAPNWEGTESVTVSGMRLIEGVWHVQIVGATTNRADALPEPGTAVYTVLSGQFDQVP